MSYKKQINKKKPQNKRNLSFVDKFGGTVENIKSAVYWNKLTYYSDYLFDILLVLGGILAIFALFMMF